LIVQNKKLQIFSNPIIQNVSKRVEKYSSPEALSKLYKWNLPALPEILKQEFEEFLKQHLSLDVTNSYGKTIALRRWIEGQLSDSDPVISQVMYRWIVKDWGGIKTGKDDVLTDGVLNAIKAHAESLEKFTFERISSWSKVIAFRFPKTRAIYDVRVIYSLNWFLLESGHAGKFFPPSSGRNSLINFFSYEQDLYLRVHGRPKIIQAFKEELEKRMSSDKSMKSSMVTSLGKVVYIAQDYAYQSYCNLLQEIAIKLFGADDDFGVTKVEMILFSIADGDVIDDVMMHSR
jgi:hypothetical protein